MNKKNNKSTNRTSKTEDKKVNKRLSVKGKFFLSCVVGVLLLVTIFTHAYGMFKYPHYENDEGIYMSQAHSLLTSGELSPYAYWYDHAPAGWIALAGWSKISGGFDTFGSAVDSGRMLMLILHTLSAGFIFYIAVRLSKSYLTASIAVLIFTLSPLAIYYQRRVLLDNMMIFGVLLTMTLLYVKQIRPWHIFVSAVTFGIAILTKESAILFVPTLLYILFTRYKEVMQRFTIIKWLSVVGAVVFLYPAYALLRGEFFPKGFNGDTSDRLSLVDTLLWQIGRGSGLPFWDKSSEFLMVFKDWLFHDPFLAVGGVVASIIIIGWGVGDKKFRMIAITLFFSWLFLLRGGVVLNFYIIPVIPFIAIAIGMIIERLIDYIGNGNRITYIAWTIVFMGLIFIPSTMYTFDHYTKDETSVQTEVVHWVKQNLPENSVLAIDDYAYVEYHDSNFVNNKVFDNADVFWKLESDPQIREQKYENDWRNIEYVITSSTMEEHLQRGEIPFTEKAFLSARRLKQWASDETEYAYKTSVYQVDMNMPVEVIHAKQDKINNRLYRSFRAYRKFFFRSYGQIIDPSSGVTTSEGQSYAMLRAVWLEDKEAFDGSWEWTRDHLQFRKDDKLISWKWVLDKLEDSTNATDADEDIALALLFAYKQWGDSSYLKEAKEIIYDLGEYAVVEINGNSYFMPAHWESIEQWDGYLFNPSYLSPASYRIFAEVDLEHDWNKVADDTYTILEAVGKMSGNSTYLPSDWVLVNKETGALSSANEYFDYDVDRFSFDAFRTLWRVSLDYQWFQNQDAQKYLEKVNYFLIKKYKESDMLPAVISMKGDTIKEYSDLSINAGYLASFMILRDSVIADTFYKKEFEDRYESSGNYWGNDKYNYYNANWAWFATAMYNGNLINLWKSE